MIPFPLSFISKDILLVSNLHSHSFSEVSLSLISNYSQWEKEEHMTWASNLIFKIKVPCFGINTLTILNVTFLTTVKENTPKNNFF